LTSRKSTGAVRIRDHKLNENTTKEVEIKKKKKEYKLMDQINEVRTEL
jgi:hypothetical protein